MRHLHMHRAAALTAVLAAATGVPLTAGAAELATVISSSPVTASVPVARQVCNDGQQLVQQRPSGAGAVIGAIAGGVIGHNLGDGFGRAAATGLGVVAGSVIGDQVEANANPPTEVPVRRCRTVTGYETRVVGYDVMYEYAGQRYSTRMGRDPGTQLAVSVQPAQPDGANVPAPAAADFAPPLAAAPPQAVYYEPVPTYVPYYAPSLYVAPVIGFGFGYYGGYRGGHRWR